jgi:hypothetical protein
LSCPEGFARYVTATLALHPKELTIPTIDATDGSMLLVTHILSPWQLKCDLSGYYYMGKWISKEKVWIRV